MFFVTCMEPGVSGTWSRNAYIYGYENVLPLFSLYLAGLWLPRPRKVTISGRARRKTGTTMTPHMGMTMVTIVAALSNITISSLPILFVNLLVLYMLPILILDLEPVDLAVAHIRLR